VLIDQALRESNWDLLDPHRVRFESSGRDGRADYILLGKNGPLCVLEAKRLDADPYEAKEQARGYAENVGAPFIVLSNGNEHWFWNYARAGQRDAYRIERLPSRDDLERLRLKNLQPPRPLMTEIVHPDYIKPFRSEITLWGYQIRAIDQVSQQFDRDARRKFLVEMATGTLRTYNSIHELPLRPNPPHRLCHRWPSHRFCRGRSSLTGPGIFLCSDWPRAPRPVSARFERAINLIG
jgi:type I restriction enzyme R subunit